MIFFKGSILFWFPKIFFYSQKNENNKRKRKYFLKIICLFSIYKKSSQIIDFFKIKN